MWHSQDPGTAGTVGTAAVLGTLRVVVVVFCSVYTLSLVTPTCPPACCLDDCSTVCVPVVWLTWLCVQSAGLMKMKQAAKKQGKK